MKSRTALIWAGLAACSSPKPEAVVETKASALRLPADRVVAEFGGDVLTYGDLADSSSSEIKWLEAKFQRDLFKLEQQKIEDVVTVRLIDRAAKSDGLTPDAWVSRVRESVTVADAEIAAFYDARVKATGASLDASRAHIESTIRAHKEKAAFEQAVVDLKGKAKLAIDLPVPTAIIAHLDLADRPSRGKPDAKVTIVEFSDFECPYCARAAPQLEALLAQYPDDVRLVYMHFPLPSHPNAVSTAIASRCAQTQGRFWTLHDAIFADPKDLSRDRFVAWARASNLDVAAFEACLGDPKAKAFVDADLAQGEQYGISSTPSFYINGIPHLQGVPTARAVQPWLTQRKQ